MIRIENLHKRFGDVRAVDGVSFTAPDGMVMADQAGLRHPVPRDDAHRGKGRQVSRVGSIRNHEGHQEGRGSRA